MRKVLVGLSLVAALILTPAAASAAPSGPAARLAQPSNVWEDIAWFSTIQECVAAGDFGLEQGTWSAYDCSYLPKRNPVKPFLLHAFINT
jgi:hypothetical protein